MEVFASGLEVGDRQAEIARFLWETFRDDAFVADFRPAPADSLSTVYAMGPEEVRDDLIAPLLAKLGLNADRIDFRGFDFSSLNTPRDVGKFAARVAKTGNCEE